ncbi:MAG: helix-turn-helix transcriptional regulator [Clostridia bacterium]|nr:helix-turn-helix transcriptional regulator [Clostridia bacterium]
MNLQNIPHWHTEYELIYIESGRVTVTVDGNLFTLLEGDGLFLRQGAIHSIASEPYAVTAVVKADAAYFESILSEKKLCSPLLTGEYDLSSYIQELLDEFIQQDEFSGILSDSITAYLFARILRNEPTEEISAEEENAAERYKLLLERIADGFSYITFNDAAAFMHFSRPYFSKYFRDRSGMTFTRYLNMHRVLHAVEMIKKGEATATEISRACGFNTIRNFNRVFKDFTGYSPNRLPKSYRFILNLRDYTESGFDPTLSVTSVIKE